MIASSDSAQDAGCFINGDDGRATDSFVRQRVLGKEMRHVWDSMVSPERMAMAILEYLITDIGYDQDLSAIMIKWVIDNKVNPPLLTGRMWA